VVNAIKANFPAELASSLPRTMDLKLNDEDDKKVLMDTHMETSLPGVFVVGDANS